VKRLVLVALIGLAAQLVDGSMGMAYGVTSSTLLLLAGFSPLAASASLHLAEVATTLASGLAHRRMGNVDRKLAWTLALPGAAGGFAGALFLGAVPGHLIRPFVSLVLLVLGCSILYRFSNPKLSVVGKVPVMPRLLLAPLGLVAGLCDAIGGGGWGPIVTTTLLAKSEAPPRAIIGSVNVSETAVAIAATLGFLIVAGLEGFSMPFVLALMAGGVLAAPFAAWLVGRVSRNVLGVAIGGVILLTNLRTVLLAIGVEGNWSTAIYLVPIGLALAAYLRVRFTRPEPAVTESAAPAAGEPRQPHVVNLDD
jgi:uncharacterized protein